LVASHTSPVIAVRTSRAFCRADSMQERTEEEFLRDRSIQSMAASLVRVSLAASKSGQTPADCRTDRHSLSLSPRRVIAMRWPVSIRRAVFSARSR
jgi:hypothetical protein